MGTGATRPPVDAARAVGVAVGGGCGVDVAVGSGVAVGEGCGVDVAVGTNAVAVGEGCDVGVAVGEGCGVGAGAHAASATTASAMTTATPPRRALRASPSRCSPTRTDAQVVDIASPVCYNECNSTRSETGWEETP